MLTINDVIYKKRLLREALISMRKKRNAYNVHLVNRLYELLKILRPRCVAFYWPLIGELDIRNAIKMWLSLHPTAIAALPVITSPHAPLDFYQWEIDHPMTTGLYHVKIPMDIKRVHPDLLLIPCVGFSKDCFRLGHGGGFYDRTLAFLGRNTISVGIALDSMEIEFLPVEAHDISLDIILTESRILRCRNSVIL